MITILKHISNLEQSEQIDFIAIIIVDAVAVVVVAIFW